MSNMSSRTEVGKVLKEEHLAGRIYPEIITETQDVIIRQVSDKIDGKTTFSVEFVGMTPYVRADGKGPYKMIADGGDTIYPKDFGTKGLLKTKLPKKMDVVWVRNGPVNPVTFPEVKITLNGDRTCIADIRLKYALNISDNSKDVMDFLGQFERQLDHEKREGGGSVSRLTNKDIAERIEVYVREKLQQAGLGVDSIRDSMNALVETVEDLLMDEPMISSQLIIPIFASISFDKNYSELVREEIAAAEDLQKMELQKMQLELNRTVCEYDMRTQVAKMEIKFQNQVKELASKSRHVETA